MALPRKSIVVLLENAMRSRVRPKKMTPNCAIAWSPNFSFLLRRGAKRRPKKAHDSDLNSRHKKNPILKLLAKANKSVKKPWPFGSIVATFIHQRKNRHTIRFIFNHSSSLELSPPEHLTKILVCDTFVLLTCFSFTVSQATLNEKSLQECGTLILLACCSFAVSKANFNKQPFVICLNISALNYFPW